MTTLSARPHSCSRLSFAHGEVLAGTASPAAGYLLLEHGGPWGAKILSDAEFGEAAGLGAFLQRVLDPLGVTPLLVRRPRARHGVPAVATVMLVALDASGGRGARTTTRDVGRIEDWDLPALLGELRAGGTPEGWQPLDRQLLVCTHARRDACCGELGRPVAAALAEVDPERTWEVSHLGGHRLAPTALVIPDGLVYGRLDPADVPALAAAHAERRMLVDSLRGRPFLPPPVQAAEIALRKATGHDRADGLQLLEADIGEGCARTLWELDRQRWGVAVETRPGPGPARPASCGAADGPPPPQHVVTELGRVGPGA